MSAKPIASAFRCLLIGAVAAALMSGCAYLHKRGNDALDFLDPGITINKSWQPQFGVYFDPFSVLPMGYSNVDANFYGYSHRQVGKLDYTNHSMGLFAWGKERRGIGPFDPNDPYDARPDQKDLTDWPTFENGAMGLSNAEAKPPWRHCFEFNRNVHVGWVGIELSCRILELVDFLSGWATLDPMGDDGGA